VGAFVLGGEIHLPKRWSSPSLKVLELLRHVGFPKLLALALANQTARQVITCLFGGVAVDCALQLKIARQGCDENLSVRILARQFIALALGPVREVEARCHGGSHEGKLAAANQSRALPRPGRR
jgi:hypothetical protein